MGWVRSAVAAAAIFGLGTGSVAPAFAQQAKTDELERLLGEQPTDSAFSEFAPVPEEVLLGQEELDELLAPVALYPDALLAQVLVAATYPLQVVKADRLLRETDSLSDEELAQRIAEEDWDPSVLVLLSGFPTVIERMAADLDWTERLGSAMLQQDMDVLAAVQRLRAEALDTGYLASNDAQIVEETTDEIAIRPADPEVVYVPNYDPALAYATAPTAAPYIAPSNNPLANPWVAGAIAFGAALLVQELFADDDDDDDRGGWDDYWSRSRPIDWRDRQFYPRPHGHWHRDVDRAWSLERDAYWDDDRRVWRYDTEAREDRARERHEAVAWARRPHEGGRERARAIRAAARQEAAAPAPAFVATPNPPAAGPGLRDKSKDAPKRREARIDEPRRAAPAPTPEASKPPARAPREKPKAAKRKPAAENPEAAERKPAAEKPKAVRDGGAPDKAKAAAERPRNAKPKAAATRAPDRNAKTDRRARPEKPAAATPPAAARETPKAAAAKPKAKPKAADRRQPKATDEPKAAERKSARPAKAAAKREEPAARRPAKKADAAKAAARKPAKQAPKPTASARQKPAPAKATKAAARKPEKRAPKAAASARQKPVTAKAAPARKPAKAKAQPQASRKKACRPDRKCPRK